MILFETRGIEIQNDLSIRVGRTIFESAGVSSGLTNADYCNTSQNGGIRINFILQTISVHALNLYWYPV
jgi:hypothetical protein